MLPDSVGSFYVLKHRRVYALYLKQGQMSDDSSSGYELSVLQIVNKSMHNVHTHGCNLILDPSVLYLVSQLWIMLEAFLQIEWHNTPSNTCTVQTYRILVFHLFLSREVCHIFHNASVVTV